MRNSCTTYIKKIHLHGNFFLGINCQKHSPLSRLLHCCPHMQGRERFSNWCYSWQHWPFKEKLNKLQKNRINSSIDSWTFVHYYSSKKIMKEFEKIAFIDTCKINYIHYSSIIESYDHSNPLGSIWDTHTYTL